MADKFDIELDTLDIDFSVFSDKENEKIAGRAMADVIARQAKATNDGKTVDGGDLKEYSPAYKRQLEKEGESTDTDLRRTGTMKGSRQGSKGPNSVGKIRGGAESAYIGRAARGGLTNEQLAKELRRKGYDVPNRFAKKDVDLVVKRFRQHLNMAAGKLFKSASKKFS